MIKRFLTVPLLAVLLIGCQSYKTPRELCKQYLNNTVPNRDVSFYIKRLGLENVRKLRPTRKNETDPDTFVYKFCTDIHDSYRYWFEEF
tara:strand:+ start:102 stop:368 length:267 start_codon:yes stop_codon:yes gene_type:complete